MAREARKLSSKGLYYVELRGETLFYDDEDREKFTELITSYFSDGGKIYGYVLEDDRICMAVKESKKGISMTMKPITVSYARYFNKRHGGQGSIFYDRFKSIPYESLKELKAAAEDLLNVTEFKAPEKKEEKKPVKKEAPKKAAKKTVKKEAPQKVTKKPEKKEPVTEKVTPPTAVEEVKPVAPKKKNRNLPSWLL